MAPPVCSEQNAKRHCRGAPGCPGSELGPAQGPWQARPLCTPPWAGPGTTAARLQCPASESACQWHGPRHWQGRSVSRPGRRTRRRRGRCQDARWRFQVGSKGRALSRFPRGPHVINLSWRGRDCGLLSGTVCRASCGTGQTAQLVRRDPFRPTHRVTAARTFGRHARAQGRESAEHVRAECGPCVEPR